MGNEYSLIIHSIFIIKIVLLKKKNTSTESAHDVSVEFDESVFIYLYKNKFFFNTCSLYITYYYPNRPNISHWIEVKLCLLHIPSTWRWRCNKLTLVGSGELFTALVGCCNLQDSFSFSTDIRLALCPYGARLN